MTTVSEMQRQGIPESMRDAFAGFRFCATMQLRTPQRILQLHGALHDDLETPPPTLVDEEWQGIWIPVQKSWRQLGVDLDDLPLTTISSEFGQVAANGGECLHYLIAVRGIVERFGSIESRIADLECFSVQPQWAEYWPKSGGAEGLKRRFFPTFLSTIPKLTNDAIHELWRRGLRTPNGIARTADADLTSIRGIGPRMLQQVRNACSCAESFRDSERVEMLLR